jgi:hypothetical protein
MHLRRRSQNSFDSFASLRPRAAAAARSPAIIYLLWSSARTNATNTPETFCESEKKEREREMMLIFIFISAFPNNSNKSIRLHPNTPFVFSDIFIIRLFMSCNFCKRCLSEESAADSPSNIREKGYLITWIFL